MSTTLTHEMRGRDSGHPSISPRRPLLPALLLAATLGWLWFVLCRQLSYEWSANEQYNYGWFVPFFAALLFWLRLEDADHLQGGYRLLVTGYPISGRVASGPNNGEPITNNWPLAAAAGLLLVALLPIRLFEVANPDWRPLSWAHALTVVGLTLLVIGYWGGKAAVRHFAFPVCFILVAVPWLTPIEAPLVQGLMRMVAAIATEALTLCGIPAQLEGNLIRVSSGVVGVSEACSGVRSLQTSLMIGLLFGELKRLSAGRRVALVAAALAIAFIANCGRAFFLVWIAATQNLAAVERWHDLAGYAIVAAVFVGTIGIAAKLESRKAKVENVEEQRRELTLRSVFPIPHRSSSTSYFLLSTFIWLLLIEASVTGWYRWHERNFVETPPWTVQWPHSAPGFHSLTIDENVRSTLRYDAGREATWKTSFALRSAEAPIPGNVTMFFFRWAPGSTSILRARAHRPDICLPNTGWKMISDDGVRNYQTGSGPALPFRHFRFTHAAASGRELYAQAFFCQHEDRVPPRRPDQFDATAGNTGNWMRGDRLRVVREGLRNQGQQVMEVVVITSRPLGTERAEIEFARLAQQLIVKK